MKATKPLMALALAALMGAGCGGGETPQAQPKPTAHKTKEKHKGKSKEHKLPKFDPSSAKVENIALVPSPVETQKALEAAGIDTKLDTLIVEREYDFEKTDLDHAAVRSGVVLADMLLTVKSAKKKDLVGKLRQLRRGMKQLHGGKDIDNTLADMQERIKADAVTRDDLLKEFDELSGAVIPELEFNGQDEVVPLIEAGSWLEGANLVARAVKAKNDPKAGDKLLKQPQVVQYFIKYNNKHGKKKAGAVVSEKLTESLKVLKRVANKEEPMTMKDIDKVIEATNDVLALL